MLESSPLLIRRMLLACAFFTCTPLPSSLPTIFFLLSTSLPPTSLPPSTSKLTLLLSMLVTETTQFQRTQEETLANICTHAHKHKLLSASSAAMLYIERILPREQTGTSSKLLSSPTVVGILRMKMPEKTPKRRA